MDYKKMQVDVFCVHTRDGKTLPIRIRFDSGLAFGIDKFICCERAAATKVGGCGFRYTVVINGQIKYLFEDEGIWFVEAKISNIKADL